MIFTLITWSIILVGCACYWKYWYNSQSNTDTRTTTIQENVHHVQHEEEEMLQAMLLNDLELQPIVSWQTSLPTTTTTISQETSTNTTDTTTTTTTDTTNIVTTRIDYSQYNDSCIGTLRTVTSMNQVNLSGNSISGVNVMSSLGNSIEQASSKQEPLGLNVEIICKRSSDKTGLIKSIVTRLNCDSWLSKNNNIWITYASESLDSAKQLFGQNVTIYKTLSVDALKQKLDSWKESNGILVIDGDFYLTTQDYLLDHLHKNKHCLFIYSSHSVENLKQYKNHVPHLVFVNMDFIKENTKTIWQHRFEHLFSYESFESLFKTDMIKQGGDFLVLDTRSGNSKDCIFWYSQV
jgi:hypothetical protein